MGRASCRQSESEGSERRLFECEHRSFFPVILEVSEAGGTEFTIRWGREVGLDRT